MIYLNESDIIIRSAEKSDSQNILNLANERFGDGYITEKTVEHWLEKPDLLIVAEYKGEFAAYLVSVEREIEDISKEFMLSEDFVKELSGGTHVLQAKSAAIVKKHERIGLMHSMFKPMLENAKMRGYKLCLASAWKYNGKVPIGKVFDDYGFVKICEKENLWYDIPDYKCVICGGRCKCVAVIYKYHF